MPCFQADGSEFSKSRPEKISDSRKDDLLTFLKDNDDVFKKSVMLYAEQLRRLDDYIDNNTEDISMEQIIIYNEDFWGEDTTLNHFEFENLHFKPESVFNHIESILLDTDKEQEKLDELSIVIILIPTGKLTPDTVIITNPTSVSGAQRIAQYLPEDGSYESKFGPFVANIADPDSITWEISAISGYKIEPQKGISDTKIKLTIEDISGNGVVRIVVTPYKAGMYSQQEEIDVTFSKVMGEMTKIETDKKAKSDKEKQEAIEREKQAKVEKERLAKIEREKQANTERERLAQIEREKQANAERERLARIEREKQANAERERLAQIEREKQANAERERQELIEKDPCPPVSEIITINDQRQKIIEEFKTEVYHIWGGEELPDPANIPLYKEEAKKSIAMIPGCKIECTPLGNNLDRFLNELATKNYNIKPEIQSRLDDCGVIDGIVIKIN